MRKTIDAADLLALVDELPSLFADDDAGATIASSNTSTAPHFTATQSLSADELGELLRTIESGEQPQSPSPPQVESRQQALQLQQLSIGANLTLLKKRRVVPSAASANINKVRDGRKQEVMYLRKAVMELETRLDVLKRNNKNDKNTSSSSTSGFTTEELAPYNRTKRDQDTAGLDDVWREVARHQCSERDKSERENTRLRVVLESQIKVAKSLEKFLMLKASASCMEIGKSVHLQRCDQLPHYSALSGRDRDAAIFHDLLLGVEQSLAEVDAVYEANGLARVETTQIDAQMRIDPATGLRVEVCASKVLPFGVHETGDAVWNHYTFAKRHMPFRHYTYHSLKSIGATADTIMEDFSLDIHTKDARASFRMRKVTRRVVQKDRVVIVWRRFTYPLEFSERPVSGLRAFEKGYIVIRKSLGSSSRPSVTLLQPCHIMYPCVELEGDAVVGEGTGNTVVGAITDFRLSTTAEFVTDTHQMVENVLMEQALKKSSSSGAGGESSRVPINGIGNQQRLA
ncbi:hypothetical protein Gpo141_00008205 [Globisporangium polare]